jgi:hypothetical protein
VSVASETRGDMRVEGLVRPIKQSASIEDKIRSDKFLSFLENELKKDNPSVSHRQAIRSVAETVFITSAIRPAWRPYISPSDTSISEPNKLPIPYANERVVQILTECLDSNNITIRREAIRWFGRIGSNDISSAGEIKKLLEKQLVSEENMNQDTIVKEKMKKAIKNSIKSLELETTGTINNYEDTINNTKDINST